MKRLRIGTLSLLSVLVSVASWSCSVDDPNDPVGDAGTAGTGTGNAGAPAGGGGAAAAGTGSTTGGAGSGNAGTATTAGTSSNAGTSSGGSSSGGTGSGGATGGTASGGTASGGTASGGSASGGMAGAGGGGPKTVKPSAGCSKGSAQLTIPNSLVSVPTGYTGKDPVPAVIAFHAAGNDNTSIKNAFNNSDLAKKYIMVYPNSTSATTANKTGWNMQADKQRYLDAQAALLSEGCVDENRIYATGHSSGAQFVVQLLCSGDADFDGVAPVASSVYCQKWKDGAVPSLIIHGVQDQERTMYGLNDGDGKKDLQPYLTSNACQMTSKPFTPDVSKCNIQNGIDSKPFSPGCVEFDGCSVKTRWCNHNDPNYGTSNHGIPCFGVRAIFDFFESL
jgi:polyhydroxybutyrate depolymerase